MTDIAGLRDEWRRRRGGFAFPAFATGTGGLSLIGPLLVALPVVLSAWLGLVTYAPYGEESAFGMAVGAASFVAMAEALILAARPRLLETFFGGLDRMYGAHKWLGISALLLMLLHNSFEPDFERAVRETATGKTAEEAGELAFNFLLALIALSWFRRLPFLRIEIPYQIWRLSHRLMGVLFAVVAFHQFFIDLPSGVDPTLSLMLNGFAIAGLVAWVFTQFVAPVLRRRTFTVDAVTRQGDATELTLTPRGRAMRWRPGQFAFLSAPDAGLSEPHPFTIASAPAPDGRLTLAIRASGGWTRRLASRLRPGMTVRLEGPYGRFDFRKGGDRQLWLAGGIGITPFLAWADSLATTETRQIHLVHSIRTSADAIGRETLQAAAARNPRFTYEVVVTGQNGRLTAEDLLRSAPFPAGSADLWFCGPPGLKSAMLRGLARLDQPPRRVRFEEFEFA